MRFSWLVGVFNSKKKKGTMGSIFASYPILFVLASSPSPSPFAFIDMSSQAFAMFQFLSLLITMFGGMIGIGFALHNNSRTQAKEQNDKIDRNTTELKNEIQSIKKDLCTSLTERTKVLADSIEEKVISAKNLEDERIEHIQFRLNNSESRLTDLERGAKGALRNVRQ